MKMQVEASARGLLGAAQDLVPPQGEDGYGSVALTVATVLLDCGG